jgi:MATE family multidrug resistance protein
MQPVLSDTASGASAPVDAPPSRGMAWSREFRDTLLLALPMAMTQLGQVAMMTTDLALIGRLGGTAVAAAALAHTVLFGCFVLGMGLVAAVAPLAAQAYGARRPRDMRRALHAGVWAAVIAGVPLTLMQLAGEEMLLAIGQDAQAAALAGRYLDGLAWSLVPSWLFMAVRNFMSALNRPEPALWITLAAIPLNAVLAWALINGTLGLPRLEMVGAGIATSIVNWIMCIVAFAVCARMRPFAKYRVLGGMLQPDWPLLRRLVVLGLPISGSFALEYGLFAMAALMMGWIGTAELAAHQIALQVASILFMVPFGISLAATVRVGQALGRGDAAGMRRAGLAAIALAVVFMSAMTLVVVVARHLIPGLFLDSADPGNAATLALVALLLAVASTFFIADGVQTVAAGALRGLEDTRVPLLMAVICFWLIGFAAAWILGFATGFGAIGIWAGLTLGLVSFAVMLVVRFERLTRSEPAARVHAAADVVEQAPA